MRTKTEYLASLVFLLLVVTGLVVFLWQVWELQFARGFLSLLGIWALAIALSGLVLSLQPGRRRRGRG